MKILIKILIEFKYNQSAQKYNFIKLNYKHIEDKCVNAPI